LLWQQPLKSALTLAKLALQAQRMDDKGYPAETTVESVAWYLLAIIRSSITRSRFRANTRS
jgi:hypothetical protein